VLVDLVVGEKSVLRLEDLHLVFAMRHVAMDRRDFGVVESRLIDFGEVSQACHPKGVRLRIAFALMPLVLQ
jgi:hypothetical protein